VQRRSIGRSFARRLKDQLRGNQLRGIARKFARSIDPASDSAQVPVVEDTKLPSGIGDDERNIPRS
jgi:hypothetical protein